MTDRKTIGRKAEDFACEYLKNINYIITDRNWFCKWGEIDIVCKDRDMYVFAEIRCRKKTSKITPAETMTVAKQTKLLKTINQYISDNKICAPVRCDFIGVVYLCEKDGLKFEINEHIKGTSLLSRE